MQSLHGQVAIVTGASRGVGKGIALALGGAGATVYITGRSEAGAATEGLAGTIGETADEVTRRGGRGVAVRCDHTVDADVEGLFARVTAEAGRLDVLVNNVWGGYEQFDWAKFGAPFWEQQPGCGSGCSTLGCGRRSSRVSLRRRRWSRQVAD
jgi:NAD(P)-dependent dehydrogenase (short-subunit alcohol dehydrogenase family)